MWSQYHWHATYISKSNTCLWHDVVIQLYYVDKQIRFKPSSSYFNNFKSEVNDIEIPRPAIIIGTQSMINENFRAISNVMGPICWH